MGGVQAAIIGVLGLRMRQMQIRDAEQYRMLAENNRINLQLIAPVRGRILDRYGNVLADNRPTYQVHSDRGGHYRWPGWLERINTARLVRSMSRKASSQDNAACEGFFGRLKTEFFYPRDWRAFTAAPSIDEVDAYIRLHPLI